MASPSAFDVFLSFRGEDTRTSFTDHLYTALVQAGIRTFRDDDGLERGEEIGQSLLIAIEGSRISIPVFSINYASSRWCLDELAKMVECRRTIGQTVLPIFFNVEPSEVGKQTGSFADAFREHEVRFRKEIVDQWRGVLREAAKISGWDLRNGHEAKLIQLVIKRVLSELNNTPLDVAKHPIGINSRVECMMAMLDIESKDVRLLGICGMGGIGKTTIAKAVYNQIFSSFEGSTFLADVREASQQPMGLIYLQNQLVSDILKQDNEHIRSVDRGKKVIKERFCAKKVLIILDDLDQDEQLDALAGWPDWFGSGSRIIITTRDEHVLNVHRVNGIYKPKELDDNQSLQLFSMHAFGRDQPPKDYMELSKNVVDTAGGLPLALEVIGSFLFDKRGTSEWRNTLDKLKKIPREKVQKRLKITYDGLDDEEKDMFLDIACFFIGMDKDDAIKIWEGCDFSSRIGIQVLIQKSLVKIDNNKLRMHDQIRDMGREIVRQESPKEPGKRSRLWSHQEVVDVLMKNMGTITVEGLLYINFEKENRLNAESFVAMSKLRLLQMDYVDLVGNFEHLPSQLRWLHWRGCPLEVIPTNFRLEELVVLDLSWSSMTQYCTHQNKSLEKLKVLNLSNCSGLTQTPDFSSLPCLERLDLEWCERLVEVHESIGHLKRLVFLNLKNCSSLMDLPSSICMLSSLEHLIVSGCSKLHNLPEKLGDIESLTNLIVDMTAIEELPDSIGFLKNLERLSLNECKLLKRLPDLAMLESLRELLLNATKVEEIPITVGFLKKLEILSARWCSALTVIPYTIGYLDSLLELKLDGTPIRILPRSVGLLLKLQCLWLHGCRSLRKIPYSIGGIKSLIDLTLDGTLIKKIPDFHGSLNKLEKLEIRQCGRFNRLPESIGNLRNLTSLQIDGTIIRELPDSIGSLQKLEKLNVSRCANLFKLPNSMVNLESLRELLLDDTPVGELPVSIGLLKKLEVLCVRRCRSLSILPNSIGDLESLLYLQLEKTPILELPNSVGSLSKLRCLYLRNCGSLRKIPNSIGRIESLVELDFYGTEITEIPDLHGSIDKLKMLEIGQCKSLIQLPNLIANARNLTCLQIDGSLITELPDGVGKVEKLEKLTVSNCEKLVKLPSSMGKLGLLKYFNMELTGIVELPKDFGMLTSLEELEMASCRKFKGFPENFGSLAQLRVLKVQHNSKLTVLPVSFSDLHSLEILDASHCNLSEGAIPDNFGKLASLKSLRLGFNNLPSLPASISGLFLLKELSLPNCTKLQFLPQLPSSLTILDATNCVSLKSLPDLSNLKNLQTLRLTNCEKLAEVCGLKRLESLRSLYTSGCSTCASSLRENLVQEVLERLRYFTFPGSEIPNWFSPLKCSDVSSRPNGFYGVVPALRNPDLKISGAVLCIVFACTGVKQMDINCEGKPITIHAGIDRTTDVVSSTQLIIDGIPNTDQDQIFLIRFQEFDGFVSALEEGVENRISVSPPQEVEGIQVKKAGIHLVYRPKKGFEYSLESDFFQRLAGFYGGKLKKKAVLEFNHLRPNFKFKARNMFSRSEKPSKELDLQFDHGGPSFEINAHNDCFLPEAFETSVNFYSGEQKNDMNLKFKFLHRFHQLLAWCGCRNKYDGYGFLRS